MQKLYRKTVSAFRSPSASRIKCGYFQGSLLRQPDARARMPKHVLSGFFNFWDVYSLKAPWSLLLWRCIFRPQHSFRCALPLLLAAGILQVPEARAAHRPEFTAGEQLLWEKIESLEKTVTKQNSEIAGLKAKKTKAGSDAEADAAGTGTGGKKTDAKKKKERPAIEREAGSALTQAGNLKDTSMFFAVPDSPAAAVLGVAPEKVIHTSTPKQLVPAIINGLDEHGNFQSGLAIDFAPGQLFRAADLTKSMQPDTQAKANKGLIGGDPLQYGRALATRTQISFAAIRGTESDDKSSRLALGLHMSFIDDNDPTQRTPDYSLTEREIARLKNRGIDPDSVDPVAYWNKRLNRRWLRSDEPFAEDFIGNIANTLYNHTSFSSGIAGTWLSEDGGNDSYDYSGTTAWSTLSFTVDRDRALPARLLFHVRYRSGERVPFEAPAAAPATAAAGANTKTTPAFVREDELLAVGGIRFGTWDFNATATAAFIKRWREQSGKDESAFRYAISAEKYIGSNMWITLSAGKEFGNDEAKNQTLVLGGVRLGFDGRDFDRGDRARKTLDPNNSRAD